MILARIQAGLSAPTSADSSTKGYFIFTTFYTATVTMPFVVSIAYWLVLHPLDHSIDHGSKGETLYRFLLISTTTLNSVIAFMEVIFLNSVRKQKVLILSLRKINLADASRIWPSRSPVSSLPTSYTPCGQSLAILSRASMCTDILTRIMLAGEAFLPPTLSSCH